MRSPPAPTAHSQLLDAQQHVRHHTALARELNSAIRHLADEPDLTAVLAGARFEVFPTRGVERDVAAVLAPGTTVHVMCPPEGGADLSVRAAIDVTSVGYNGVPHIAARTVTSRLHLEELLGQMAQAGVREAFFPGGDGATAAGPYTSAVELLDDVDSLREKPDRIGVASYPQGHPAIPESALLEALLHKQRTATFMVSQTCLDASAIVDWLRALRSAGVTLPLMVGIPGTVPVRRLLAALRQYGVNAAVTFLRSQHGMVGALLRRRFSPEVVVNGLAPWFGDEELGIAGLHFFTFNEIGGTDTWRQRALAAATQTESHPLT